LAKFIEVDEEKESEEFWKLIGGKSAYLTLALVPNPRLFELFVAYGEVTALEIAPFVEDDLERSKIFILDAQNEIFLWVGDNSTKGVQECAIRILKVK
jgi:hypothetical protein